MDFQLRILFELIYEVLIDVGIDFQIVRNFKIGVFVGVSGFEVFEVFSVNIEDIVGYGMIGCFRLMFVNRVFFIFDFKGLSFVLDIVCFSLLFVMDCVV